MRLKNHIQEKVAFNFFSNTGKGFYRYDEMDENNLFIERDLARRWHKENQLMTVVYAYDGLRMIGWAAVKYEPVKKNSEVYGIADVGYIGVFVDPEYRGKGVAKQLLMYLKKSIDYTTKTPVGKHLKKINRDKDRVTLVITHASRIEKMVKEIFNDKTIYDDPQYRFRKV